MKRVFNRLNTNSIRAFGSSASHAGLGGLPATQVTVLPNGIRVASAPNNGDATASLGVWINAGSRYENSANNGVAHFLEHMMFKGTPSTSRTQLEEGLENLGSHLNAYTSREQTTFYGNVLVENSASMLNLLADMLQNSNITDADVERERDTILREMEDVESIVEEVLLDRLHYTAYRNHPLGQTILGPVENIQSISRDDLVNYRASHYTGGRMVIAASGGIAHEDLVAMAGKAFGTVPSDVPSGFKAPVLLPAHFSGSDIRIRYDDYPEAHVAFAFPVGGWNDADHIPLMVIQQMLGSFDKAQAMGNGAHSSSQLVTKAAQWENASRFSVLNTQYSDTGLFGISAVGHEHVVEEMMDMFFYELTRVSYECDEDTLETAKTQLKTTLLCQQDSNEMKCEEIGRHMLQYGRHIHLAETFARIDSVDINAVKNCAKRFFYDRDFALAAIGPIHEINDYAHYRRRTYWHRF